MKNIYLVGDIHGGQGKGLEKLNSKNFPEAKNLNNDYLIFLGDFGLPFKYDSVAYAKAKSNPYCREELYYINWLTEKFKTCKLLVTLGNHENYPMIRALPKVQMFGDEVHKLNDNIFFFRRGKIYNIEGMNFLNLDGALSVDKSSRILNVDYFSDELWNYEEEIDCLNLLDKYNWEVDYVVSHTCPNSIMKVMFKECFYLIDDYWREKYRDPTAIFFNHLLEENLKFKKWFFGHFHDDREYNNFYCLFNKVIKLS